MSIAASQAARTVAAGNISTTTIALIGAGTFCLANPEKALHLLQRALLALSDGRGGGIGGSDERGLARAPQQPIVIHAGTSTAGGSGSGGGLYYMILQLSVGAGLCWGSYALLINVLPEQAKNMLPVTQGTFKAAVTSLGKGLLHVKDTLSAEISALLAQQTELSHKQDETHEQVLYVQDQVSDVHDDISHMQSSIDDCHAALQTTDKRTTYIAKGIRLVTAGMTAMLPPDDALVKELQSFQKATNGETAVAVPRNKIPQDARRAAAARSCDGSHGSRRSQRSSNRRSSSRPTTNRNKPVTTPYESSSNDTLSVSTGTPVRNVVIPAPRKSKASGDEDDSITQANPELKELEDVRQLLVSMDKHSRLAL